MYGVVRKFINKYTKREVKTSGDCYVGIWDGIKNICFKIEIEGNENREEDIRYGLMNFIDKDGDIKAISIYRDEAENHENPEIRKRYENWRYSALT